jgi:hypothetical protein
MRRKIEELKDEIEDLIERQKACRSFVERMRYQNLIDEKGTELEDLESDLFELSRQYV